VFRTMMVAAAVIAVCMTGSALAQTGPGDEFAALIGSELIKDNTVKSRDVQNGSLRSKDIRDRSVQLRDLTRGLRARLGGGGAGDAGAVGPQGATGPAGPQGAPGISALESDGPYPGRPDSENNLSGDQGAQSTDPWVNDGTLQSSWVQCPPGKTALGGGFGDNDGGQQDQLRIVTSAPTQVGGYDPIPGDPAGSFRPDGWLVEGYYTGTGEQIVRPHVICAVVG
jgi:hypothetical protein